MTRLRLLTPLMCLAFAAGPVAAVDGPPSGPGYIGSGLGGLIFISPSGQPFRAAPGGAYPVADWFAIVDANHDGKISSDEFNADAGHFFGALDVNGDGYISSAENTRYESQVAPEITHMDPRIDQPKDHTIDPDPDMDADPNGDKTHYIKQIIGAAQYGLMDEPQPIRAADANFDFRVSHSEWVDATSQRFTILDHNGDGFITMDELPKTPLQQFLEAPRPEAGKGGHKKHGWGGW